MNTSQTVSPHLHAGDVATDIAEALEEGNLERLKLAVLLLDPHTLQARHMPHVARVVLAMRELEDAATRLAVNLAMPAEPQ
jgi:hypothetical protein